MGKVVEVDATLSKSAFGEVVLTEEQLNAAIALSEANDGTSRISTAAEVAKVRDSYQIMNLQLNERITRIAEKRTSGDEFEVSRVNETLEKIGETFEKISCGRELAADAQVLETVSNLSFASAQAFQQATAGRIFSGKSFAKKLLSILNKLNNETSNELSDDTALSRWAKFGTLNDSRIFKSVPALNTLRPFLFTEEPCVHAKKERIKREREKVEAVKLKALTIDDSDGRSPDLTRQLDNVYKCLKQQLKRSGLDQIGYYEFCLHPTDFARTVENIFYISFLVKEAKVKIIGSETGLPFLDFLHWHELLDNSVTLFHKDQIQMFLIQKANNSLEFKKNLLFNIFYCYKCLESVKQTLVARVSETEKDALNADDRTKAQTCQGVAAISVRQWKEFVQLLKITEPAIKPL